MAKNKDKNKKGANLVVLADVKKNREEEEAPLEAFAPQALKIDGSLDDWYITGCDGEQFYLWLATKRTKKTKRFKVVEVYPGRLKRSTELRGVVESDADLILSEDSKEISDVLQEIEYMLFEGMEFEGIEA